MEKLEVKVEKLKNASLASMITVSEEGRRMQDMMKMYGMDSSFGADEGQTLVLNAGHPLVQYLKDHKDSEHAAMFCNQLYDLAQLSHGTLTPERMTEFITRSNEVMLLMTK